MIHHFDRCDFDRYQSRIDRKIKKVEMVGMPASVSFVFDGEGRLNETIVFFPTADLGLVSSLMQGIQGRSAEDRPGNPPSKVWRDGRRGSIITAMPAGSGSKLLYRPA